MTSSSPTFIQPGQVIGPARTLLNDMRALKRTSIEGEASRLALRGIGLGTGIEVPQFSGGGTGLEKHIPIPIDDITFSCRVPVEHPSVISLTADIANMKTKPAAEIADDGAVEYSEKSGRIIEKFYLRNCSVTKVTLKDADILKDGSRPYGDLAISKDYEDLVTAGMGRGKPALDVEQMVAANVILATGGNIGSHPDGYWARARDLAQQQLWLLPNLEAYIRQYIDSTSDDDLLAADGTLYVLLCTLRNWMGAPAFNPYYQAERDDHASSEGLYEKIDSDIFMAVDKNGEVIAFSIKEAFEELVGMVTRMRVTQALDSYKSLQPVPALDKTRYALHYADWLDRYNPDLEALLNFSPAEPSSPPAAPKCGTYTIGLQSATNDPDDPHEPCEVLDIAYRGTTADEKQLRHVRLSVLGPCTAVADFYLDILDPDLRKACVRVTDTVEKHHSRARELCFRTRPGEDPFALRSVNINTKRYEQDPKVEGRPWERGLGAFAVLGHFIGGDLLLRELGLQVACPPGSMQIFRNGELRHSTMPFVGKRFEISHQTPEGVRRWAEDTMSEQLSWGDAAADGMDPFPWDAFFEKSEAEQPQAGEETRLDDGNDGGNDQFGFGFGFGDDLEAERWQEEQTWPSDDEEDQQQQPQSDGPVLVFPPEFFSADATTSHPNFETGKVWNEEKQHYEEEHDYRFEDERLVKKISKWLTTYELDASDPNTPLEN
ncbi:hypothetical protein F4820DRAFT_402855 [Hypoxylon rubiginosum]|uniref:Uncharacterized protein n=1 Tax=Hypoxylon rubiginosum TaxID=110542 RepID=A0ACB9ZG59_9PEZI|nr:hypothetical protein F4820DRAFT_402855 [Hypoxylon rubiginosum]